MSHTSKYLPSVFSEHCHGDLTLCTAQMCSVWFLEGQYNLLPSLFPVLYPRCVIGSLVNINQQSPARIRFTARASVSVTHSINCSSVPGK